MYLLCRACQYALGLIQIKDAEGTDNSQVLRGNSSSLPSANGAPVLIMITYSSSFSCHFLPIVLQFCSYRLVIQNAGKLELTRYVGGEKKCYGS